MTTSANHAGTEKRFSEVVWTSIQGLDIIRRETSFWENDTFLSHERPFFSSSASNFLLVSSLRIPWEDPIILTNGNLALLVSHIISLHRQSTTHKTPQSADLFPFQLRNGKGASFSSTWPRYQSLWTLFASISGNFC